jgi:hypothetical protein
VDLKSGMTFFIIWFFWAIILLLSFLNYCLVLVLGLKWCFCSSISDLGLIWIGLFELNMYRHDHLWDCLKELIESIYTLKLFSG